MNPLPNQQVKKAKQMQLMRAEKLKIVTYTRIYELILQVLAPISGLKRAEIVITVLTNLHLNKAQLIIRIHKIIMAAAAMHTSLKW